MASNCNLVSVLGVLLIFTLAHNVVMIAGQNIPAVALFAFGDSNFDAGNRKYLTSATLAQNFWPYGKFRDDPNGKFLDGKIVADFIGKFDHYLFFHHFFKELLVYIFISIFKQPTQK